MAHGVHYFSPLLAGPKYAVKLAGLRLHSPPELPAGAQLPCLPQEPSRGHCRISGCCWSPDGWSRGCSLPAAAGFSCSLLQWCSAVAAASLRPGVLTQPTASPLRLALSPASCASPCLQILRHSRWVSTFAAILPLQRGIFPPCLSLSLYI